MVLAAVGRGAGGQLALVLGAGCSFEPPTGLPLSKPLAVEAHRQLVLNEVLAEGDCANPEDLSCVADAVYAKLGHQREVVGVLPVARFRLATPNEGALIAAALLLEGVVRFVVLLNYDLSLPNALSQLGADEEVRVIRGPQDQANLGAANVVFLHRSVDADPEDWVLRSESLERDWQNAWEQVIAQMVLPTPVVVFAGLGTPVGVLLETVRRIDEALPQGTDVVAVDVVRREESAYAAALELGEDRFVKLGWSEFMRRLGVRRVAEHEAALKAACEELIRHEGRPEEQVEDLCARAAGLGLLRLGGLRASWLLRPVVYLADEPVRARLVGDLLLVVAALERTLGARAALGEDGLVELWIEDRRIAVVCLGSGEGYRRLLSVQEHMRTRQTRVTPTFAIAAHWSGPRVTATPPIDLVRGEPVVGSIMAEQPGYPVVTADELRSDPALAGRLVGGS